MLFFTCMGISESCANPAQRHRQPSTEFDGFWQGPHPVLSHVSFIIQVKHEKSGLLSGRGWWVNRGLYQAGFSVDSISIEKGCIRMVLPQWGCTYTGKYKNSDSSIHGIFSCPGEPPDSVMLSRADTRRLLGLFPEHLDESGSYCFTYNEPEKSGSGLPTGKWKAIEDHPEVLHAMMKRMGEGAWGRIHSFLLIKHGRLVCEEYFYGFTRKDLHPVESVTKSITSLLVGITIDQGCISSEQDLIEDSLPGLVPADKSDIQLRHLLTMTSGIGAGEHEMVGHKNRTEFILHYPLVSAPGKAFRYNACNTELLGSIIKNATGLFADEYAEKSLFGPLSITRFHWDTFRQNGYPLCGGSLWITPQAMAKIGLLVLNRGLWKSEQIVSRRWLDLSFSDSVATGIGKDRYGYQWWISDIRSGSFTYRMLWANGMGSQFILIFPERDMVVVFTGGNWEGGNSGRSWDIFSMLDKYINFL